jgi:hypothetical protein
MAVEFRDTSKPLSETLGDVASSITGSSVTLRQLLSMIGEQGLLLFCILLIIPFLLPVSIPGVSTVFGAVIILISFGVILNRVPWLPGRLMDREFETAQLVPTLQKGAQMLTRVDRIIRPRLLALTNGAVANRVNGLALLLGGILLIFPLGLIPFSNTLPALAILFLAVGILQRDGLFILLGYIMLVATIIYFGALALAAIAAGSGIASLMGSGIILPLWLQ